MEKTDITTLLEKTEAWILPELESIFDEKEMEDVTVKAAMYSPCDTVLWQEARD